MTFLVLKGFNNDKATCICNALPIKTQMSENAVGTRRLVDVIMTSVVGQTSELGQDIGCGQVSTG